MKHPFIIFGSIGAALMIASGVGVYFILFYTPPPEIQGESGNPFIEVGGDAFGTAGEVAENTPPDTALPNTTRAAVQAFTVRKVAGAVRMEDGTFRFVEAGTGHVYETAGGSEKKLSLTTFPQTQSALWSPTGSRVALIREDEGTLHTYVGTVGVAGNELIGSTIPGVAQNVAWSETGETVFYTTETNTGSEGVAWDQNTNERSTLFTTPLRQIQVSWSDRPLIITRAADGLVGYAYRSDHTRVTEPMEALQGISGDTISLFSGKSGDTLISWLVRGKDTVPLTRGVIPQKCSVGSDEVVCAVPREFNAATYPGMWQRGEVSYSDEIVRFDARTGEATVLGAVDAATHASADIIRTTATKGGYLFTTSDFEAFFLQALDAAPEPDTNSTSDN